MLRDEFGFTGVVITDDLFMMGARIELNEDGDPLPQERTTEQIVKSGPRCRRRHLPLAEGLAGGLHDPGGTLHRSGLRAANCPERDARTCVEGHDPRLRAFEHARGRPQSARREPRRDDRTGEPVTAPSSIVVGVDVPSPDPDCGIDYERLGSLPMGVPPALLLRSTLKEWIAAMAAKAAVFTFARPADDGLDPQRPTALRVAQIANLNAALTGVANVIVRRSLGVGAPTQIALSAPKVDAVGRRGAVPPTSTARATWYGALDSSFPWDDSARGRERGPAALSHGRDDAGPLGI